MSFFTEPLKVKIDKENNKVTISIRVNEFVVNSYTLDQSVFDIMIAQYQAQKND